MGKWEKKKGDLWAALTVLSIILCELCALCERNGR